MENNNRKYKRAKGNSVVQFKGDNFLIYSNLSNICEGGIFVNTFYMLDKGENVNLPFDLPKVEKTITARGKIVRNIDETAKGERAVGLGVAFEDLDVESKQAIKKFMGNA